MNKVNSLKFLVLVLFGVYSSNIMYAQTIKIGKQYWDTKNLDVAHFRNGDLIAEAKTNKEWEDAGKEGKPAWCYHDNNSEDGKMYGKLYNWFALNDPRGLAPLGWHIPNTNEFKLLIEALGGFDLASKKMRSTTGWLNNNGDNSSGLSVYPGGFRNYDGKFKNFGENSFFWTTTERDAKNAHKVMLSCGSEKIFNFLLAGAYYKESGLSIRCIKD